MPDAPKPVTLGDLRVVRRQSIYPAMNWRPATVADLMSPEIRPLVVSALRAEGVLVVQRACALVNKPGHQGCTAGGHKWVWNEGIVEIATAALLKRFALDKTEAKGTTIETFREDARVMLDALAEAQPFPPAGG